MSQAEEPPEVYADCNNPSQSSVVTKADSEKAVIEENPLDAATFIPPIPHPAPSIIIEFCDRVSAIDSVRIIWIIFDEFLVSVVSLIIIVSDIVS